MMMIFCSFVFSIATTETAYGFLTATSDHSKWSWFHEDYHHWINILKTVSSLNELKKINIFLKIWPLEPNILDLPKQQTLY